MSARFLSKLNNNLIQSILKLIYASGYWQTLSYIFEFGTFIFHTNYSENSFLSVRYLRLKTFYPQLKKQKEISSFGIYNFILINGKYKVTDKL